MRVQLSVEESCREMAATMMPNAAEPITATEQRVGRGEHKGGERRGGVLRRTEEMHVRLASTR
jgi:hypothetical protein